MSKKIVEEEYKTTAPTQNKATIKRLKRRKAEGPDEIPMECYKEMNEENQTKLKELITSWWNNEDMTEEETKARVVTIFQKGDTSDISNCRQISLLNSTHKTVTAI